jgi:hypothetical protein
VKGKSLVALMATGFVTEQANLLPVTMKATTVPVTGKARLSGQVTKDSVNSKTDIQELLEVLDQYLKMSSTDGMPARQPLRKQLKELLEKLKKSS